MTPELRTRLTRLLMLTTSDRDGEALAAIRMANRALGDAQMSWEDVMVAVSPTAHPQAQSGFESAHQQADWPFFDEAYGMLKSLVEGGPLPNRTAEFVDGLITFLNRHDRLTDKQMNALRATWAQHRRAA